MPSIIMIEILIPPLPSANFPLFSFFLSFVLFFPSHDAQMHGARLVEIMDGICGHDFQCNALMEDAEAHLEEWWEKRDDEGVAWNVAGLQSWLCVETLKVCCPAGHYGKKCKACPGTDGKVCSGQGSCAGDGLRSGTGKCKCHSHFTGEHCSVCEGGYFKATEGNLCLACDPSCALNCTGPGPAACGECRAGYETVFLNGRKWEA